VSWIDITGQTVGVLIDSIVNKERDNGIRVPYPLNAPLGVSGEFSVQLLSQAVNRYLSWSAADVTPAEDVRSIRVCHFSGCVV